MKKGKMRLYEYDMGIYPRKLWVAVKVPTEELRKIFDDVPEPSDDSYADVSSVLDKQKKKGGELVRFFDTKDITPDIMAHEALHVAFNVCSYVDIKAHYDNQEPIAYLLGWVVRQIHQALKGDKEHLYDKKV